MVGSKEVRAALDTNPAYQGITLEEVIDTHKQTGDTTPAFKSNAETMKEMGLDLEEVIENLGPEVATGFVGTTMMLGDPVPAGVACFVWGLQVGFQLGRGYIEDES